MDYELTPEEIKSHLHPDMGEAWVDWFAEVCQAQVAKVIRLQQTDKIEKAPPISDEYLEKDIQKDYPDFLVKSEDGRIADILQWTRESQRDADHEYYCSLFHEVKE